MRDAFVKAVLRCAQQDRNVELLTGDLGFGVLRPFWETLPDQFLNLGIAEQNMTAVAAGMALEGKTVFTYSIGNFPTLRCLEQIRNDCAYMNANVKIVCIGGGFTYGSLGMSHHATEDLAVMGALPGVTVFAPADAAEAAAVAAAAVAQPGTCYIRLGRGGEPAVRPSMPEFRVGMAIPVRQGDTVAIFSTGAIYEEADAARKLLESAGIRPTVYTFPTVKPLDEEVILRCARTHRLIVTCEEHNLSGGFGSGIAGVLARAGSGTKLLTVGIEDHYCSQVGDQKYLRRACGIDGASIARRILQALEEA